VFVANVDNNTTMKNESESAIIESWGKNVEPWIRAIRNNEIESRILVTNKAVVDVVLDLAPRKVLDIGCGEGWLVRVLSGNGFDVLGIDAVPELIAAATGYGAGRYRTLAYSDLSVSAIGEQFDVLVCNFSLFGHESVVSLFQSAAPLLNSGGAFVVQTLHPANAGNEDETGDGWRKGSWEGFSSDFRDAVPWYFRTIDSWKSLFAASGFALTEMVEPVNPETGLPVSIVFVGRVV